MDSHNEMVFFPEGTPTFTTSCTYRVLMIKLGPHTDFTC